MASELKFELNSERLRTRQVREWYGHLLPNIIQVTQGHFGETNMLTYSAGHTMRLHCIATQQRVVAKDVNGKTFSFPLDYAIKFRVARNFKKGKEQTLREIVGETTLPVRIELCLPPDGYSLHIGQSIKQIESFGVLHLQQTYEETYFLANSITDESLDEEILSVPVYLNDLVVAVVKGIEGKDSRYFHEFQRRLDDQAATFDYNVSIGNPDIAVYDQSLSPYTQPTHYIRYSQKITGNSGSNLNDIRKRFLNKATEEASSRQSGDYSTKIVNEETERPRFVKDGPPIPDRKNSHWPSPGRVIATKFRTKSQEPSINKATVAPLEIKAKLPQAFPPIPAVSEVRAPVCSANEPGAPLTVSPTPADDFVKEFSIRQIVDSLTALKLDKYAATFEADQISGVILLEFDVETLKSDYGFKSVEAIKLMKFARTGYVPK